MTKAKKAATATSKKVEPYSCVRDLENVGSENVILKDIAYLIDNQLAAPTRTEAIYRAEELFEYLLVPEVSVYVDRQPKFKAEIRCKLQELMRSGPTPAIAYTLGRVYQRFFA
jgi:hypothetical protein